VIISTGIFFDGTINLIPATTAIIIRRINEDLLSRRVNPNHSLTGLNEKYFIALCSKTTAIY
jgi:hypothetical protein